MLVGLDKGFENADLRCALKTRHVATSILFPPNELSARLQLSSENPISINTDKGSLLVTVDTADSGCGFFLLTGTKVSPIVGLADLKCNRSNY